MHVVAGQRVRVVDVGRRDGEQVEHVQIDEKRIITLTGERPEPTFLVTKPFNPDMVKALISQALFFDEGSRAAA